MLSITGHDLWDLSADLRVLTTNGFVKRNGDAVMGRGIALEATRRYPGIASVLGNRLRTAGNHVHLLSPGIASMPVKHLWWDPADPRLIVRSAHELVALVNEHGFTQVVMPRPGCGNGRLDWRDVEPLIAPILDDRFTVVTF